MSVETRYIAMDMDGTLLQPEGRGISTKTKEVLLCCQEAGHTLVLVSGRIISGLAEYAKELRMDRFGGYVIGINGAQIMECRTEKRLLERKMPPLLARRYIKAWKALPLWNDASLATFAYLDDGRMLGESTEGPSVLRAAKHNCLTLEIVNHVEDHLHEDLWKVVVSGDREALQQGAETLREQFREELYLAGSSPVFLEAMPLGVDKGSGLLHLMDVLGADISQVIAFGDGENDLPLLQTAGMGVAMGNALESVKQSVTYHTLSNAEDGIAHFLTEVLNLIP